MYSAMCLLIHNYNSFTAKLRLGDEAAQVAHHFWACELSCNAHVLTRNMLVGRESRVTDESLPRQSVVSVFQRPVTDWERENCYLAHVHTHVQLRE